MNIIILIKKLLFNLYFLMVFVMCSANLDNIWVDVNDILSPSWMPGTLLENVAPMELRHDTYSNQSVINVVRNGSAFDGSIGNALDTMIFHRSMINQYLCRNYVANQIVSEMSKRTFNKRISDVGPDEEEEKDIPNRQIEKEKSKINELLDHQGSSSYEDWLLKSATLDDIYRHHNKINGLSEDRRHSSNKFKFEETNKSPALSTKHDRHQYHGMPETSEYLSYDEHQHGYEPHGYYMHQPAYHHAPSIEKDYKKGDKISDLFEIALTALAFLSFGMFIVHLCMSISAVTNNMTSTINPRIPALQFRPAALNFASDSDELDQIGTVSTLIESHEHRYRSIREPANTTGPSKAILNELAKRVLRIMDSALIVDEDDGRCLLNSLCNATKYSRSITGKTKLFMALVSFGVSWLSDSLSKSAISKTESLQAIIFGLGMSDCDVIYKNCQLKTKTNQPKNKSHVMMNGS